MTPKDKLGQEIKVGSYIVYGHALGRCAGLRLGKVLAINEKKDWRWIEDRWTYTVQGVDHEWAYEKPWDFEKAQLTNRKGFLAYLTRIVVLNESQVPKEIKKLLDESSK